MASWLTPLALDARLALDTAGREPQRFFPSGNAANTLVHPAIDVLSPLLQPSSAKPLPGHPPELPQTQRILSIPLEFVQNAS